MNVLKTAIEGELYTSKTDSKHSARPKDACKARTLKAAIKREQRELAHYAEREQARPQVNTKLILYALNTPLDLWSLIRACES